MVFRGTSTQQESPHDADPDDVSVYAVSFDGQKVFLGNSRRVGPYLRFATDASIEDYSQRIKFGNLLWDFESPTRLQASTIADCLHQVDPEHCLVCMANFVPRNNHRRCEPCDESHFRQNSLDACVKPTSDRHSLDNSSIKTFGRLIQDVDLYGLGSLVTVDIDSFTNFGQKTSSGSSPSDPSQSVYETQIVPDLNQSASKVHLVRMLFGLAFFQSQVVMNPTLFLLLNSTTRGYASNHEFDAGYFVLDSTESFVEVLFTLHGNPDQPFLNVYDQTNFLLNSAAQNKLAISSHPSQTVIEYTSLGIDELLGYLESTTVEALNVPARVHPLSFPLDYLWTPRIYHAHSLTAYLALDESTADVDGFYASKTLSGSYLAACATGCKRCSARDACSTCHDGYFLSHGACSRCADECLTCESHSEQCTQCATGSVPAGMYDFAHCQTLKPRLETQELPRVRFCPVFEPGAGTVPALPGKLFQVRVAVRLHGMHIAPQAGGEPVPPDRPMRKPLVGVFRARVLRRVSSELSVLWQGRPEVYPVQCRLLLGRARMRPVPSRLRSLHQVDLPEMQEPVRL